MKFEMWSLGHIFYILSPAIAMVILYFLLRKRSSKTVYIVGLVLGILSLLTITTRSIYYYMTHGFHPQEIPLQVCHFGNIVVFFALAFKSKTATAMAWSLNMTAAFSSLVLADSLAKYETIWGVLPQCYIWGHFFIVLGALYPVILKEVRIKLKDFFIGLGILFVLMVLAVILNSYFNDVMAKTHPNWFINYFYLYNSKGVPFDFIYNLGSRHQYGWFTINWVYVLTLVGVFIPVMFGIFCLQKPLYRKDKADDTKHVFYNLIHKN